jgi:hypothetical protein
MGIFFIGTGKKIMEFKYFPKIYNSRRETTVNRKRKRDKVTIFKNGINT